MNQLKLILGVCGVASFVLVATFFTDYLGARVLSKNSARATVSQGDKVTIQLSSPPSVRKVEICTESSIVFCATLQSTVNVNTMRVPVTIPPKFPVGKASIVVRTRDSKGKILSSSPNDEKIPVLVVTNKNQIHSLAPQGQGSRA